MKESELRSELIRLLNECDAVVDNLVYRELWHLVGDPANHPIKLYSSRVDSMSRKFHQARADAAGRVRARGEAAHYLPYYREVARGFYSLGCLRFAGILYSAHVIAVVNVRHHQIVLESITEKLPAFA